MKNLLLGIDVGTYSSKAVVTTLSGKILRTVVVPHGISIPQPGYVEQDADAVWWKDLCELCKQIFAEAPFAAANVVGVAVSAIGPCLLPLDSSMKPLRAAILYGVDVRAELEIAEMEAELGTNAVMEFSLMGFTSQAVGPKIRWLRKHEPELWRATAMLTSASSYLVSVVSGLIDVNLLESKH